MELNEYRRSILGSPGNLLILGGPGSGKTTIALLKAVHDIREGLLAPNQKILFLSFARATVARVKEHAGNLVGRELINGVEICTYHGFTWNILQSHGYLLNGKKKLNLLTPPEAASRLSHLDSAMRNEECRRLFFENGVLCFDLFAALSSELLAMSPKLASLLGSRFPIVILDEFQDTNNAEWGLVKAMRPEIKTIALADPHQRIYEFRGADPERIGQYIAHFNPATFDFGFENNRSGGTDIGMFGNDLLTGANKAKKYEQVAVVRYGYYAGRSVYFPVKVSALTAIKKLKASTQGWSLAVLVPTKQMMVSISDYFSANLDGLPSISHDVALEADAVSLSAIAIAGLIEGGDEETLFRRFVGDLIAYIRGRKGSEGPKQSDLKLVIALESYLKDGKISGTTRKKILEDCRSIASARSGMVMSGNPAADWLSVARLLEPSEMSEPIRQLLYDVKFLRLLHKGSQLRESLGGLWRRTSTYVGAVFVLRQALQQEHFANPVRSFDGVNIMTIHKSKGKEFDHVVIFEGYRRGKFLRQNANPSERQQALLALRVAVTRAKRNAVILTPKAEVCEFLV